MNKNIFYVYFLVDPRSGLPFYVGKGKDARAESHLKETLETTENIKKFYKIQSIRKSGIEPVIDYVFTLLSEDKAYDIEAKLIAFYGRQDIDDNGILTNICSDNRPPKRNGPFSTEAKEKRSKAQSGDKNHRYGKGHLQVGELNPNYGNPSNYKHPPEVITKISGENHPYFNIPSDQHPCYGLKRSDEFKLNRTGDKNPMFGKPCYYNMTQEEYDLWRSNLKDAAELRKGIPIPQERKDKISAANKKPKKRVICPVCGLEGGESNMKRYHFANCKNSPDTNK